MVLEYLQVQSKACASLWFSASPPRIGYLSLSMHEGLSSPSHTYIHILFYLVSYTSYIDIVPNKFTIWQFSNVKDDFQSVPRNLEFVYDFCFVSCKTSQNVAFRIYLHEVNSNFHDNRHFRREALCFILPGISLDENLHCCKNQWKCWKKNLKGLKDKVCGS